MVRQKGGGYYRVRILKEESTRIRIGTRSSVHTVRLILALLELAMVLGRCKPANHAAQLPMTAQVLSQCVAQMLARHGSSRVLC